MVTPFTGVWIEIAPLAAVLVALLVTPFTGVWIEILTLVDVANGSKSHSLHGSVD